MEERLEGIDTGQLRPLINFDNTVAIFETILPPMLFHFQFGDQQVKPRQADIDTDWKRRV